MDRAPSPTPPQAERREHTDVYHGETLHDPFFWLRERNNPAVRAYLEAENAYTAQLTAALAPRAEALYQEMLGRIQQTDLSVPVRRGAYLYYSRTQEGLQYPIHCRKRADAADAPEEILLDQNELARGQAFCALGAFALSDDAQRLAYSVDFTGMRRYQLFVKELAPAQANAAVVPIAERVTSVEWAADHQTLFYTTEDEVTKRSDRLWRHRLGAEAHEPVYFEPDELYSIGIDRTRDRRYLLLGVAATDSTEFHFLDAATPTAPLTRFRPRQRDHKYDLDHRAGLFYVRTNLGAKNFRVITMAEASADWSGAREFLPHDPSVLIEGLDLFDDFAVAVETVEALTRLRVHRFAERSWTTIPFPEPVYAASPGANPEPDARRYRYHYQSPVTPPSVFDYDMASGATELLKQQPVLGGYDASAYEAARLWATAADGTRVPLSAVWRKGAARPGPLLLYGYGLEAGFSSARLSLLDRGVTYVIAHVRGGNEMGEAWHDAGMLMHKKNTFTDFIACAEHLVAQGWTTPHQMAIEGGSAGGLLIGAVVNMRPDLFQAAHLAVPFVDVIHTMMDESLPLTVGEYLEWGDPHQPAAYAYMRSYSPYDNIAACRYPAMLVTTSLNDSQVMYWEPAKYAARLRQINPGARVLLKTNLAAGHGGASGRYDRLREVAFEYTWLLNELGALDGAPA
jgi:oligopeptidase B